MRPGDAAVRRVVLNDMWDEAFACVNDTNSSCWVSDISDDATMQVAMIR